MKNLFLILFLTIITLFSYSQTCEYTLRMNDTYGDGWGCSYEWWSGSILQENAKIRIKVNGVLIYNDYLQDGFTEDIIISLNHGDDLLIRYVVDNCDTWEYENSFDLLDCFGTVVWSDGGDGKNKRYRDNNIDCASCTLPVDFMGMNYDCSRKTLTWETSIEINNDYFSIKIGNEYKHGVLDYHTEFTIEGNGNSNEHLLYIQDIISYNEYIELWQTDYDGTKTLLDTKFSNCVENDDLIVDVIVYPNPATEKQEITIPEYETIHIYDMSGKEINIKIENNKLIGMSEGFYIIIINNHYKVKLIIN